MIQAVPPAATTALAAPLPMPGTIRRDPEKNGRTSACHQCDCKVMRTDLSKGGLR